MYDIIDNFISFVKGYFEEQDKKEQDMVFKYFGIENSKSYTFEEIGTLYSVTKQRIQKIEKKHVNNLKILISGNKLKKGNYICEGMLINEFSEIYKKIEEEKVIKKNDFRKIISFKKDNESWENLLINLLNSYTLLVEKCNCEVIVSQSLKKDDLKKEILKTYNILKESIIPMSIDDLIIKSKKGRRKFDDNYIKMSINCLKLDQNKKNNIFLAIDKNFSAGDLAYRVLWLENKTLKSEDILIKINKELSNNNLPPNIEKRNLVNQMASHSKIESIRKKWGLKIWDNDKRYIKEIIKNVLNSEGKPLSKDEIKEIIIDKYSDIKESSIMSYLSYDDFLQLKNGNIILKEWKSKYISEIKEKKQRRKFDEILLEVYRSYGKEKLSFREILSYVSIEFGIDEIELKRKLENRDYISQILEENINYYILKKNHIEILSKNHGNIINGIKNKAEQLLLSNGDMKLSELKEKLENYGYNESTIYTALRDKRFEKLSTPNRGMIVSLKSKKDLLNIGRIKENEVRQFLKDIKSEEARFDFKQGFLTLDEKRRFDEKSFEKIMMNVCAMANHGIGKKGRLFIGITDKEEDTKRIEKLDGINAERVNNFGIVGLEREAIILKKDLEKYQNYILEKIEKSKINEKLKAHLKSNMTFTNFNGKHILMLEMECIDGPSLYDNELYIRKGPNLHKVTEKENELRNEVYRRCFKQN
nr:RNA-binding domain-containing protein [uncultured Leptotrichia sp.]